MLLETQQNIPTNLLAHPVWEAFSDMHANALADIHIPNEG